MCVYVCVGAYVRVCVVVDARARACACVRVALLTKIAAVLPFSASMAPSHFSTLFHKRHDFRKKLTKYNICILILSACIFNISQSKKTLARYCLKRENVLM